MTNQKTKKRVHPFCRSGHTEYVLHGDPGIHEITEPFVTIGKNGVMKMDLPRFIRTPYGFVKIDYRKPKMWDIETPIKMKRS